MKNIRQALLIFTLTLFTVSAYGQTNNLVVFTQESKPFYVVVNGVRQNMQPETNVKVTDLKGSHYKVKVIFADGQTPDVEKGVSYMEMGKEISMEVKERKGKYKLRYAGEIDLAQSSTESSGQSEVAYHDYEYSDEQTSTSTSATGTKGTSGSTSTTTTDGTKGTTSTTVTSTSTSTTSGTGDGSISIQINIPDGAMDIEDGDGTQTSTTTTTSTSSTNSGNGTSYSGFMTNGSMCATPTLSQKDFLDLKYDVEAENMYSREDLILKAFKNSCVTSQQVADIINIDYPTVDAEVIAKQAYRNTWDTENYGIVLESIKSSIKREKVMKFLNVTANTSTSTTVVTNDQTDVNYDSDSQVDYQENEAVESESSSQDNYLSLVEGYSGSVGCIEGAFIDEGKIKKAADNEAFADNKMNVIKQASKNKCFTVQNVKNISETFSHSSDKMEFVKWAYGKTYDVGDYYKLNEVFTFSSSKDELDKFIESQKDKGYGYVYSSEAYTNMPTDYDGTVVCYDPIVDGNKLKEMVDNESFSDDKINVIKQALKSKCITVDQFKSIADSFSHESDLLKFAEIAYPRTYDQDNFYEVNSVFTFSSSKDKLNEIMGE